MYNNWQKYGIDVPNGRYSGNTKVFCPKCHSQRSDKRDRSLSVNLTTGQFHCHYCQWSGSVAEMEEHERDTWRNSNAWYNPSPIKRQPKVYRKPKPKAIQPISEKALKWFFDRGISQSTLSDMRVTEGREWMPQKNGEANTVQFNYYKNGELVNTKYRTGDKCFKLESGAELLPYNIDSIKNETTCIITEGEMDALSFYEIGFRNVVSVPNGANANLEYLDDYIEDYFENKEIIYVASDSDTKGIVLRDELLRRFGVERCRVVEYGDGCKDANEHLMKYGADSLRNAIFEAKEIRVEGVFTVSDFEDTLDSIYQYGLQKGVTIGHEEFDNLCSFETKRLCIVTGIPGSGKSEFLDEIAERLNIRYGWRFAFFSPENAPLAYHASKLVEKFVGKKFSSDTMGYDEYVAAKQHLEKNFFFISPSDNFKLDNILEKARVLVRRKGIKALVIDPYNRLESEMGTKNETHYISELLDKLTIFSQVNDVLTFLMAHPTKLPKDKTTGQTMPPTLYDISGSANFFNKTDFGLVVHRDRVNDIVQVYVSKVKFRHLGTPGVATFKYNLNNGRYVPYKDGDTAVFWDNSNHLMPNSTQQYNEIKVEQLEDKALVSFFENTDDEVPY